MIDALLAPINLTDEAISRAWDLSKSVPTKAKRDKTLKQFLNDPKVTQGLKDGRAAVRLGFQEAVKLAFDELSGNVGPVQAWADTQVNAYVERIVGARKRILGAWYGTTAPPSRTGTLSGSTVDREPVPHLAGGGIVRRPTFALIGESGPEAVIPFRQLARGGLRGALEHITLVVQNNHTVRAELSSRSVDRSMVATRGLSPNRYQMS